MTKKVKQIIKELYENGEIDKIINMDPEVMHDFGDEELCEYEKSKAQLYKDALDCLDMDIEDFSIIPLIVCCQSVLILQSIIFKLVEKGSK